jgi:hypothetical protein
MSTLSALHVEWGTSDYWRLNISKEIMMLKKTV